MSKKVKTLIVDEIKARFADVNELVVVSTRGVDGIQNNQLRGALLSKRIHMNTVKNTLAKYAFKQMSKDPVCDLLDGPTTLVYGGESIVDIVKELTNWAKKIEHIEIKGGFLDGQSLNAATTADLAKMPSRKELLGMLVSLSGSPGSRLAAAVLSPGGVIAGCLKTLIEKKEKEEVAAA
jgi:large subunit ribosomal protein L10